MRLVTVYTFLQSVRIFILSIAEGAAAGVINGAIWLLSLVYYIRKLKPLVQYGWSIAIVTDFVRTYAVNYAWLLGDTA